MMRRSWSRLNARVCINRLQKQILDAGAWLVTGCVCALRGCGGLSDQSADTLLISANPPAGTLPLARS